MAKSFGAVRVKLSVEEKEKRIAYYLEDDNQKKYQSIDIDNYLSSDVYDEYVVMVCPSCKQTVNVDIEIINYLMYLSPKYGYPRIDCPHRSCTDFLIPGNLFETEKNEDDDLPF